MPETRSFVPRVDNEGGIGTALKRWASGYINALIVNSIKIVTGAGLGKFLTSDVDGNASWGSICSVVAKTSGGSLSTSELAGGTVITNTGAAGAVTLTLPAATAGYAVKRVQITVAQYLRLSANGTDVFRCGSITGAAGGYIRSNSIGSGFSLTCTITGIWDIHDLTPPVGMDE